MLSGEAWLKRVVLVTLLSKHWRRIPELENAFLDLCIGNASFGPSAAVTTNITTGESV